MRNKRDQILAAVLTLACCALTFTTLLVVKVSSQLPEIPPMEQQEVFFADIDIPELREIKVQPTRQIDNTPASAPAANAGGTDAVDSGVSEAAPALVAADEPQPDNMQVAQQEDPEPPGPTEEEINAEKSAAINNRIGNSFRNAQTNADASGGAAKTGNATAGNNVNADGLGIAGRTLRSKPKIGFSSSSSITNGWIEVSIIVDAEGKVTSAKYAGRNSGNLGQDLQTLAEQAEKYAAQLQYSADKTKPRQFGIITLKINTGKK